MLRLARLGRIFLNSVEDLFILDGILDKLILVKGLLESLNLLGAHMVNFFDLADLLPILLLYLAPYVLISAA
jgi:hypothetical protein